MEESIKISGLGRNKLRKIFDKLPTVIKKDISALSGSIMFILILPVSVVRVKNVLMINELS